MDDLSRREAMQLGGIAAGIAYMNRLGIVEESTTAPTWNMVWNTSFPKDLTLGQWSMCDSDTKVCSGLPKPYVNHLGAYPQGWPDTATKDGLPVGGIYDPDTTLSISNNMLHVNMWRGQTGPNHVAAIIPLASKGQLYGRYVERFRVSQVAVGFKSAHLLWPAQPGSAFEVDFPERDWDKDIYAFVHSGSLPQIVISTTDVWTDWHVSDLRWSPGLLEFYLDGSLLQSITDTRYVPNVPMSWIIQNESSLDGETTSPGSSGQLDISHLAYFSLA